MLIFDGFDEMKHAMSNNRLSQLPVFDALAQGVFHDEPCRLILREWRVWCGSAAIHAARIARPV
jgi:hypothetical protein